MLASTRFFDPFGEVSFPQELKRMVRSACPQSVLNWREARFYARYGEVELHLLDILCRRNRESIDVGANDGSYVHFLRRSSRLVHAFEPMPELADALSVKFAHSNVTVHRSALSSEEGTAELRMPVVDGVTVTGCSTISSDASTKYAAHRTVAVPMHRLDNIYSGDVGFIKIDVEGHQQAVLEGALRTIQRNRPRMLVEVEDRLSPGGLAPARAYFDALSYRGFFVYGGKLHPAEEFSVPVMQDPANLPDLTAPLTARQRFGRYVYNFLFLPSEEARTISARLSERLAKL
ncbi:MAG TPA: FkbM family methyltransferase [Reyranella sp.]|jgi:FkbM family methyltransferase|nr:FkbM family methyltransferase [Reyranella sp.]